MRAIETAGVSGEPRRRSRQHLGRRPPDDVVIGSTATTPRRPVRRPLTASLLLIAGGLIAAACSTATPDDDGAGDGDGAPATTAATPATPAATPATSEGSITPPPAPVTTGAPPTTASRPTPTTVLLPVPSPPPADGNAHEPVVELGRIAIPVLGIDRTLYEGIRLPTFDLGPGHWPGTAAPGAIGNMVVGGHRTAGAADFRHLDQLVAGDEVVVTDAAGTPHTYVVESWEVTGPFAAKVIHQTPERTATLFACHPPGSVRERIVVHLTLV